LEEGDFFEHDAGRIKLGGVDITAMTGMSCARAGRAS